MKLNSNIHRIIVTQQFILHDDTIIGIHKRISASILTSTRFNKNCNFLTPDRIALYLQQNRSQYIKLGYNFTDPTAWGSVDLIPNVELDRYYQGAYVQKVKDLQTRQRLVVVPQWDKLLQDYIVDSDFPVQLSMLDIYHELPPWHLTKSFLKKMKIS